MKQIRQLTWLIILALSVGAFLTFSAYGQDEVPEVPVEIPSELRTPESCYDAFITGVDGLGRGRSGALDQTLLTLDLGEVPTSGQEAYGEETAWKLAAILETLAEVDAGSIPDTETEEIPETSPVVLYTHPRGTIEITRDGDGAWRFSRESVKAVAWIYWEEEQAGTFEAGTIPEIELPEGIPEGLGSARACYETYLAAVTPDEAGEVPWPDQAVATLDLNRISTLQEEVIPEDIVRQLGRILDVVGAVNAEGISNYYTGPPFTLYEHEEGSIELGLSIDGAWRITATSVSAIPLIYFAMVESHEIELLERVEVADEIPGELATPRRCYLTYFEAMREWNEGETGSIEKAVECLDMSEVPGGIVHEYSVDIAKKLGRILDYTTTKVDPEIIPDDPAGPRATIYSDESGTIEITQGEDGAWRFSPTTIEDVPEIFRSMEISGVFEMGESRSELSGRAVEGELNVRDWIPASWKSRTFLLEDWQWLYLILIILVGLMIDRLLPFFVRSGLRLWLKNTFLKDRVDLISSTSRPFGFLAMSAFWWLVLGNSGLDVTVLNILLTAAKFLTAAGMVWCAYRAVDIFSEFIEERADKTESRMDDLLAPFIRKSLKVFVAVFGVIFVASNIDINVTSLLAGLGIGGIAIALAAKDTLENLIGSVTVLFDRPFQVGDWIVIDEVEGTVEELGFRSTRVRTFYNSLITVPNSKLVSASVDNFGAREYRRIKTTISVTYDTPPEKIEAFCEGIREILLAHPYTRKDYYHVWLNEMGASSLDILLYCFLKTPDWATELRERHRLFLGILRLGRELGVEFAFPTQSIYMAKEKPGTPVFPEDGDIRKAVRSSRKMGGEKARRIAESELGGPGIMPDPVRHNSRGSVSDTGDED